LTVTCRDEVLAAAAAIVSTRGENALHVQEIVEYLKRRDTRYAESTIRTHVVARCCRNAPRNFAVTYDDFERVGRGRYAIVTALRM
jgi:hypothetical protein